MNLQLAAQNLAIAIKLLNSPSVKVIVFEESITVCVSDKSMFDSINIPFMIEKLKTDHCPYLLVKTIDGVKIQYGVGASEVQAILREGGANNAA